MDTTITRRVEQWRASGVIDADTARRIRTWEREHGTVQGSRLGRLAFAFGGALLAAGILLFVAANWAQVSPWARFALLALTVATLHLAAALVPRRTQMLATTLHAVGTAALGAGIFLAGQTFHLAEQWPAGFLLWSIGAAFALWWLRDAPHVLYVATLVPAWLVGEWDMRIGFGSQAAFAVTATGLFVLGAAYLSAVDVEARAHWRHVLARLGAVALVGAGVVLPFAAFEQGAPLGRDGTAIPAAALVLGWSVAALVPLAVGFWLRGRAAWPLVIALAFAVAVTQFDASTTPPRLALHVLYLLAAVGLTAWGVRDAHRLRVNVGVLAFALTVLSFYYSSVFDRIGRSLGLVALGVLFIGGGWLLERTRRRLLSRIGADTGDSP
ncbi:MAG TPA: DUF2157 domain-containing protein [Steroidobacteraceae bacterium]|nr:DUF2157 domain-containing protein [Steroidobacteraceae bacterium]